MAYKLLSDFLIFNIRFLDVILPWSTVIIKKLHIFVQCDSLYVLYFSYSTLSGLLPLSYLFREDKVTKEAFSTLWIYWGKNIVESFSSPKYWTLSHTLNNKFINYMFLTTNIRVRKVTTTVMTTFQCFFKKFLIPNHHKNH